MLILPGADKTRLPRTSFLGKVHCMSTVELAVKKVKKLSAPQARELLGWLDARQTNGTAGKKPRSQPWWRKGTARQRMKKLKAWQDSVRLTTDWEPPRMPDDLVKRFRL
jgi:hypothetical protein